VLTSASCGKPKLQEISGNAFRNNNLDGFGETSVTEPTIPFERLTKLRDGLDPKLRGG
jgi:hypothetical protein